MGRRGMKEGHIFRKAWSVIDQKGVEPSFFVSSLDNVLHLV